MSASRARGGAFYLAEDNRHFYPVGVPNGGEKLGGSKWFGRRDASRPAHPQLFLMTLDGIAARNSFTAFVVAAVASSSYLTVVPFSAHGSFRS